MTKDGPGIRAVVADDNIDSRDTLATILELLGFEVRKASDGAEAVRCTEEFDPAIVLLDIGMPVMDGLAAVKVLRERPLRSRPFVAAVTGYHQAREQALQAGFDAFFVKPLRLDELERSLSTALHR